ncbi:hypothetical protein D3C76_1204180 [compost metagenome]
MQGIRFQKQIAHLFRVDIQRESQRDGGNALRITHRRVTHVLGNELRVRDNDRGFITELNFRRTHVDATDITFHTTDAHQIPHFHRAFRQQNQTGDKVLYDLLQTKTDTDRQGADDPRQPIPLNAEHRQGEHNQQDVTDVGEQRHQRRAQPSVHRGFRQEFVIQPAARGAQDVPSDHQAQHGIDRVRRDDVHALKTFPAPDVGDFTDQF